MCTLAWTLFMTMFSKKHNCGCKCTHPILTIQSLPCTRYLGLKIPHTANKQKRIKKVLPRLPLEQYPKYTVQSIPDETLKSNKQTPQMSFSGLSRFSLICHSPLLSFCSRESSRSWSWPLTDGPNNMTVIASDMCCFNDLSIFRRSMQALHTVCCFRLLFLACFCWHMLWWTIHNILHFHHKIKRK